MTDGGNEIRNPIDSHSDIFPWPYAWERDIADGPYLSLQVVKQFHPQIEVWTYNNHWNWSVFQTANRKRWLTDIYWDDPAWDRGQVPPAEGDRVAATLIELNAPEILCIIWHYRIWTPADGWQPWVGVQGDFVDHLHVEWDYRAFPAET